MKPYFTAAAAVLALVASASVVAAQQSEEKKQGPAAQQQDGGRAGNEEKSQRNRGQAEKGRRRRGPAAAKEKQAEPKQPAAKEKQAEPKQPAAKEKQAEPKRPAAKEKQAEPKQPAAKEKQAEPKQPAAKEQQAGTKEDPAARVQVTDEQRTRIRQTINVANVRKVTNVNFAIAIGTRVPRDIRLNAIPVAVIGFAPQFRDHRYFVVDDRICIVHPTTYVIVAVIDNDGGPRTSGQQVALELTAEERRLILARIDRERYRADVPVRLALGAEVPERVELYAFPEPVLERVSKVRDFRFIVVDRDVVIVDPNSRGVALVINQ